MTGGYAISARDARPETRLATVLSIADHTRSVRVLDEASNYSPAIIEFWLGDEPDYEAAIEIFTHNR